MRTYKEVEELIKKYDKGDDFIGGVSEDKIEVAEKELEIKFLEEYKWFLREYGHGGVLGIDTIGIIEKTNSFPVVRHTKEYRKHKLGHDYIVIEDHGEFYYCINLSNGKVESWDYIGFKYVYADSFLDYLYIHINNKVEDGFADDME
jgi:hypothetical protein